MQFLNATTGGKYSYQWVSKPLTLTLLTWTIWPAPTNASKWRMGFNSAFKGSITHTVAFWLRATCNLGILNRKTEYHCTHILIYTVSQRVSAKYKSSRTRIHKIHTTMNSSTICQMCWDFVRC